jgi:superfamily II DNA or RNA helicase
VKYLFDELDDRTIETTVRQVCSQNVVLRPYQTESVAACFREWESVNSTLVCLPTGTGKSVVFSEVMRLWNVEMQGRILLIAHRKELITQALGHARRAGMTASIEMGSRWADHSDVIAASWQTMLAVMKCPDCHGEGCPACEGLGKRKRMTRFAPNEIGLIIIDESHHAVAKSYRSICAYFKQNTQLKELHVTATPKRADKKGLHNVCDSVAYEMNLRTALDEAWLVPIRQKFVTVHGLSLSDCRTRGGDFIDSDIEQAFLGLPEDEQRLLHEVAGPVVKEAKGERAIVFCAGKEHALKLTAAFNSYDGIEAAAVFGDTEPLERQTIFENFASGLINVLVNVMVCTEGYDCPSIAVVANCRPTKSESMYLQIIGRGTRTLPGTIDGIETAEDRFKAIAESAKPYCTVLDFAGTSGEVKLVSVADILAGSSVKPVDLAEAKRIAAESDEPQDMDALMEKAKRAREEKEERAKQRKLKRTQTTKTASNVDYTADDVSLYDGHGSGIKSFGDHATDKQIKCLVRLKMPRAQAERLSKRQASAVISKLIGSKQVDNWKAKMGQASTVAGLREIGERIKLEPLKAPELAQLRKAYSDRLNSLR